MRIVLTYLVMMLAIACGKTKASAELDAATFNTRISESNVQLLDVRTAGEFNEGHISNALNIDIKQEDFDKKLDMLYKDVPVYVYCRSGARSGDAAERLTKQGFKEVITLKGGTDQWTKNGLPLVESEEPVVFKDAIQGDKLVLVDFNAPWCAPCRQMQPFVDRMAWFRKKEVTVISINTDVDTALRREYDIAQLPTFMLFKKGQVLHRTIGGMEEAKLNALVDTYK